GAKTGRSSLAMPLAGVCDGMANKTNTASATRLMPKRTLNNLCTPEPICKHQWSSRFFEQQC
ncbi:MAG TPA: hypothetical protein PLM52_14010, partial [Tabrizicola sp.]|nr:hypothetical protein [Tabrizicola sp.]